MAIAACFVFQREISRSVFWDFFDSIGHGRKISLRANLVGITSDRRHRLWPRGFLSRAMNGLVRPANYNRQRDKVVQAEQA
jgi:hypothetical protein